MISARFSDVDNKFVTADIEGVTWSWVPLDAEGEIPGKIQAWIADGNIPDPYVAPARASRPVEGVTFLARLVPAEYQAIIAAAAGNAALAMWIEMLRMRGEIDVTATTAQNAKAVLVGAGLLTPQRADAVFAPAP